MKEVWVKVKSLFSWKVHPGYLILSIFSLLGYGYYLGFHFLVTPSRLFSSYFAAILLAVILLLLYYAAYRWVDPSIIHTNFHQKLTQFLSAIFVSAGVGIWFVQFTDLTKTFFLMLERWLPTALWNAQRSNGLLPYSPFFLLTIVVILLGGLLVFLFNRIKGVTTAKIQLYSYAFFLISVTTCIYVTDFLEIPPGEQSIIFFGGTEDYINYRLRNVDLKFTQDLREHGGFIYGHGPRQHDYARDYLSQTGFYGSVLKLLQSTTKIDPEKLIIGSRLILGSITAGIFTALSFFLKKSVGFIPSIIFSFFCMVTFWFIGPSTHLIWFFPLFFIPSIISLVFYPKVLLGKMKQKTFLHLIFLGQIFVFLRGYEYAPVLLLSPAIPAFYFNLQAGKKIKEIVWNGFMICLVSFLSLAMVMAIHTIQLSIYFDSLEKAFRYLLDRSEERGVTNIINSESIQQVFHKWMKVKVFYISKRITSVLPNLKNLDRTWNNFGRFHLIAFAGVIFSGILKLLQTRVRFKGKSHDKEIHQLFLLAITTLAATLSSWSWFPAIGHMSAHYHMNGIMYMILMGIAVFVLWGMLIQTCIHLLVSINPKTK